MKRGYVLAGAGAAIIAAGLSGCSSNTKSADKSSTGSASASMTPGSMTSGSMTASAGAGTAKITIDGKPKEMQGQVVCTNAGGNLNIAVGGATSGIAVIMAEDASKVSSVALGNVDGVVLGFQENAPGASASATKDGSAYKISGTASGVDMANPMQPITKPFEIEVSCP